MNDLEHALSEQWCNGCGKPRSVWGPICCGMTQGDYTHFHSPEWWIRYFEGAWGGPYERSIVREEQG